VEVGVIGKGRSLRFRMGISIAKSSATTYPHISSSLHYSINL
jgi:hypothetical protein